MEIKLKQLENQKPAYQEMKTYEIHLYGRSNDLPDRDFYSFCTLVSTDGYSRLGWMPNTAQQHVNPLIAGENDPVTTKNVKEADVAKMIKQILLFQTKKDIPLESILENYGRVVNQVLGDFKKI